MVHYNDVDKGLIIKVGKKYHRKEKMVELSKLRIDLQRSGEISHLCSQLKYRLNVSFNSQQQSKPIITPIGVRLLLEEHPILTFQEGDDFICFAGFRSFAIAQLVLESSELIPVKVYPSEIKNEDFNYGSFYLTHLFYALEAGHDLGEIWCHTPPNLINQWTPGLNSRVTFAKHLGMSKNTVFPAKNRTSSK